MHLQQENAVKRIEITLSIVLRFFMLTAIMKFRKGNVAKRNAVTFSQMSCYTYRKKITMEWKG